MSWVFLTGSQCLQAEKAGALRSAWISEPSTRGASIACEELRLNRLLAASVYVDVVALSADAAGTLRAEGDGAVVDWLVKMRRLAPDLMLDRLLEEGTAGAGAAAIGWPRTWPLSIAPCARAGEIRPIPQLPGRRDRRLRARAARSGVRPRGRGGAQLIRPAALGAARRADLFEARVAAGRIVEGHGDLRPGAHLPRHAAGRHRLLGVLGRAAHARRHGRTRLPRRWNASAWVRRSWAPLCWTTFGDCPATLPPPELIHFYQSLRACIRAKLTIWHLREARYRDSPKWPARARQYLGLAARHLQSCESALEGGRASA